MTQITISGFQGFFNDFSSYSLKLESYGQYQWHPGSSGFLKSSILIPIWILENSILLLSNWHNFEPGG